jgi:hypothetical protein
MTMDRIKELKSEAYDILAAMETKQAEYGQLKQMLHERNAEIQRLIQEAQQTPQTEAKKAKQNG